MVNKPCVPFQVDHFRGPCCRFGPLFWKNLLEVLKSKWVLTIDQLGLSSLAALWVRLAYSGFGAVSNRGLRNRGNTSGAVPSKQYGWIVLDPVC